MCYDTTLKTIGLTIAAYNLILLAAIMFLPRLLVKRK